jgi:DNA processing protein
VPEDREELEAWLVLLRAPSLGARRIRALLERFGSAAEVLRQAPSALRELGLPEQALRALLAPDERHLREDLKWLESPGRRLLCFTEPDYPPQLASVSNAPAALFLEGDPALLLHPQVAVVGSRNASAAGRAIARDFARALARAGFTVTSGLAEGIDAAAHRGALEVGGKTIAVTGCGPDRIYPPRHAELQATIAREGLVASEFPPGTPPRRAHFPMRNRIIAGLSLGVLVVEAGLLSGSLITARLAAEAGREVFAVPGSIRNPLARGCHRLLREGALLVEDPAEIIEALAPAALALGRAVVPLIESTPAAMPNSEGEGLDPEYARLLDALGHGPESVDALVERTGLTIEAVSSMLLLLELNGLVASAGSGRYQRIA